MEEEIIKVREFCNKVKKLAKHYDLPFFIVTKGASATRNNNCEAVKHARESHKKWEIEHGFNSKEDWEIDKYT